MCLFPEVYCWHCETKFTKQNDNKLYDFENCPHCGKGFDDLSQDAQKAVLMTLKPFGERIVCTVCGKDCDVQKKDETYHYCCLHVPAKYITKPLSEWICKTCRVRLAN